MSPNAREWPVYVCIHGHFYQPPRENPWTNRIERQESAAPYHDWNERITEECYRANAYSRYLDGFGRIEEIVDNFAHINFNVGPTLLSWIRHAHPDVYARIIAADRRSMELYDGEGNAIAQVFNHVIMPLADHLDRRTQVRWGMRYFERHFGRRSLGIWLSETAINDEVVDLLIDEGIRYVILSPTQAQRVRPLRRESLSEAPPSVSEARDGTPGGGKAGTAGGGGKRKGRGGRERRRDDEWLDVSDNSIDPKRAYRIVRGPGRFLDVFFYDGPIAAAVSFEGLLHSADAFAERLASAVDHAREEAQIIHIATDGETFGHHHPFGDMCLAALIKRAAAERGMTFTNYALFLKRYPPRYEVQLKSGPGGEGTAWSCAHGVGRWYRDCGCAIDPGRGWSQAWRTPLREGLDHLREELRRIFLRVTGELLKDPWAARDDYIEVLCADYETETVDAFLRRHEKKRLGAPSRSDVLQLLESQKYAMYMYTSCGWFFDDISGLEPVQNLKYAARAIELARPYTAIDLEQVLCCHLARARSNIPKYGDGVHIYRTLVKPYAPDDLQVAFDCLACAMEGLPLERYVDGYELNVADTAWRREECAGTSMGGVALLKNRMNGRERRLLFAWLHGEGMEPSCWMREAEEGAPPSLDTVAEWEKEAAGSGSTQRNGWRRFGLEELCFDLRETIMLRHAERLHEECRTRSEEGAPASSYVHAALRMRELGVEAPVYLRRKVAEILEDRLAGHVGALASMPAEEFIEDEGKLEGVISGLNEVFELSRRSGVEIETARLAETVFEMVERLIVLATEALERRRERLDACVATIERLLDAMERWGVELRRQRLEDRVAEGLESVFAPLARTLGEEGDEKEDTELYALLRRYFDLALRLNFSPSVKDRWLGRYERILASRSDYWP